MHFSFQTLAIAAAVTVIHLVVITAMKPATLEASKYFQALEMGAFVEEVLVKQTAEAPYIDAESEPTMIVSVEEIMGRASREPVQEDAPVAGPEQAVEVAEKFLDMEKEMDSVKAVADVRIFAGRIPQPNPENFPVDRLVAEPVAAQAIEKEPSPVVKTEQKPKKTGPFELREIRPLSRP